MTTLHETAGTVISLSVAAPQFHQLCHLRPWAQGHRDSGGGGGGGDGIVVIGYRVGTATDNTDITQVTRREHDGTATGPRRDRAGDRDGTATGPGPRRDRDGGTGAHPPGAGWVDKNLFWPGCGLVRGTAFTGLEKRPWSVAPLQLEEEVIFMRSIVHGTIGQRPEDIG